MELTEKICTKCKVLKSIDDSPPDKRESRRNHGYKQAQCRACINEFMKLYHRNNPAKDMVRRSKVRAKKRGLEFNLTVNDITPLPDICPVFGTPLRSGDGTQDPWAYSLDRIDNSKGYVRGNVAVMSYKANRLKNDGSAADHEKIAAWMRQQGID
jgi:hypothetical protein